MGAITDSRNEIFPYGEESNAGYTIPEYGISEQQSIADTLEEEENPVLVMWDDGVLTKCSAATDIPSGVFVPGSAKEVDDTLKAIVVAFGNTVKLVAAGAITEGDLVVVAASGKVQATPRSAGTYYQIGQAIESGVADDEIKVVTQPPIKVVVTT